jgi:DNA-binding protein YbaB
MGVVVKVGRMKFPANLFGGAAADVERELDQWVAGFERNAERYRELQRQVEDVRLISTSPSGVVTVSVDATGVVTEVRFTDRIVSTAPEELAAQFMTALNHAKAQIAARVRVVAEDVLGPEGRDSADRITNYYGERFPETREPEPNLPPSAPRSGSDYEDFGGGSIFGQ